VAPPGDALSASEHTQHLKQIKTTIADIVNLPHPKGCSRMIKEGTTRSKKPDLHFNQSRCGLAAKKAHSKPAKKTAYFEHIYSGRV
jgi:hypothetical protein